MKKNLDKLMANAEKIWKNNPIPEQEISRMPGEIKNAIKRLNFIGEFTNHRAAGIDAREVGQLIEKIQQWDYRATNWYFRKQYKF